ncbi:MAG: hypothetical protein ACRCZI_09695, partial [Cetobacterium sp.]
MKRTLLQTALSWIPALDHIKSQLHLEVTQGRANATFYGYVTLVESFAIDLDSRNSKVAQDSLVANMHAHTHDLSYQDYDSHGHDLDDTPHDIDTPIDVLEVYRARQTQAKQKPTPFKKSYVPHTTRFPQLSLDRETWAKIPKESQDIWDSLPPNVKAIILTGTCKKGMEFVLNRKTVPSDKYGTSNANVHTIDDTPIDIPDDHVSDDTIHIHEHRLVEHDYSIFKYPDDLDESIFINLAKSHLHPGDIRRVLSQSSKIPPLPPPKVSKKTPSDSTYTVSFH